MLTAEKANELHKNIPASVLGGAVLKEVEDLVAQSAPTTHRCCYVCKQIYDSNIIDYVVDELNNNGFEAEYVYRYGVQKILVKW